MRQKTDVTKPSAEKVIKDIRCITRKQYGAEEKIRIVLEGLRGEESIAALCRREAMRRAYVTIGRRSSCKPARSGWRVTRRAPRPPMR